MRKIPSLLFTILFYLGILIGILWIGMATWADMEATSYEFDRTGGDHLNTLYCPILMTADETSTFSVKLTNTTSQKLSPSIRTDVSAPLAPVSSTIHVELLPGETKRFEWKIGPENIKFGQFIFARVWVNAMYPLSARSNVCGVFIVDLPTNGRTITWMMVGFSLLGTGIGFYGVSRAQSSMNGRRMDRRVLSLLALLILVGMIASFMGVWLLGLLVIVVGILLTLVSFYASRQ